MSIPRIIATSDLVATVPHPIGIYFTRSSANIKVVKLPLRIPPIGLKQHWHRRFHGDAKSKWLRGVVSRLFNDESDEWRE